MGSEETQGGYIGRVKQYQNWYDGKAVKCKSRYLSMRVIAVVGALLVPVTVNLPDISAHFALGKPVSTLLGIVIAATVSLEGVYHYREQWKNYRSTEQYLGRELVYYETGTGPYERVAADDAFRLLVDRVERAIAAENASTLSVMTLANTQGGSASSSVVPPAEG
jgi:hypothetical protein